MEVLAHRIRTKAGQLGNSMANLRALNGMGITWIEADIYIEESTNKIWVHHPGKVKQNVDAMDLLAFLTTLSSLPKMHCLLEFKQNSRRLVIKTVSLITKLGLQDRIYLTAFQRRIWLPLIGRLETNGQLLIYAKNLNPNIKTHLVATWPWNLQKLVKKYRVDAISFGWLLEPDAVRFVSKILFRISSSFRNLPEQISEVQRLDVKVWSGICNNPEDMIYLAGLGVDGIITDEPEKLMDLIRALKI